MPNSAPHIFISAAEPSGDLHAASLIHAVRKKLPGAKFTGVAGPNMTAAGCRCLYDMCAHSSMLTGVIASAPRALRMLSLVDRAFGSHPFDVAVVVDSPTLHLPMARRAKVRNIPVLYYIAPQTWAWAENRISQVRNRTDRLGVILPFEEEYFRTRGCRATYVGHPLFDVLTKRRIDPDFAATLPPGAKPIITLLPGSRKHVVREVLPGQIEVAKRIKRRYKQAHFMISVANEDIATVIEEVLGADRALFDLYQGANGELIPAADLVLVTSGTSTLEVAFYHKPMIVMYNASRLGYHLIGRWLIATPFLSLVNILAKRELVPEFMPYYRSPIPIAEKAIELLGNPAKLERIREELAALMDPLVKTGASSNAADLLIELLESSPRYDRKSPRGTAGAVW